MKWSTLAVVGALTLLSAAPASADSADNDGLWYFDWFLVQDAHDEGITGEGVTIAVLDSPINPEIPTLADADIRVQDPVCVREDGSRPPGTSTDYEEAEHGTSVLSLVVGSGEGYPGQTGVKGLAPDATVLTYHVQLSDEQQDTGGCPGVTLPGGYDVIGTADEIALSMHAAIDAGADIITTSITSSGSASLAVAVARAIEEGVIVVSAQPNEGEIWAGQAPGNFNGVVTVNHVGPAHQTHTKDFTDVSAPGEDILVQGAGGDWQAQRLNGGTSLATPIVVGNLALAMQKYPEATSNQLIQSLIHNTDAEGNDLEWDPDFGYGVVITDVFLAADPTVYPDVHPLVHNYANLMPFVDFIWAGATRSTENYSLDDRPWPVYDPQVAGFETTPEAEPGATTNPGSAPAPTDSPAPPADEPSDSGLGWLIPGMVVGVVILVAIGIAIAVVIIRSNRPAGGPNGTH